MKSSANSMQELNLNLLAGLLKRPLQCFLKISQFKLGQNLYNAEDHLSNYNFLRFVILALILQVFLRHRCMPPPHPKCSSGLFIQIAHMSWNLQKHLRVLGAFNSLRCLENLPHRMNLAITEVNRHFASEPNRSRARLPGTSHNKATWTNFR